MADKDWWFVTVFHTTDEIGISHDFGTIGGFQNVEDRDLSMSLASDSDITWIRPGVENDRVVKNIERRGLIEKGLVTVDMELVSDGQVIRRERSPLLSIRNSMAFVGQERIPFCLSKDDCAGYWCCDKESGIRLSSNSLEKCIYLLGSRKLRRR